MRGALALAAWLMAASAAMAQQTMLAPSAAVECLSPPAAERGVPEYPFAAYKQQLNGRVRVQLRFTGAALAPAVTVLEQDGDASFVDAVQDHVRSLRVPCLQGEQPVDLLFDFVFRPDEPRPAPLPQDADDARRAQLARCLTNQGGSNMPDYPPAALRQNVQGRVLVAMRFDAPDRPPEVRLLPRTGGDAADKRRHPSALFLPPLRDWTAGYRLPCLQGPPVTLTQTYVYRIEGDAFGFMPGLGLRDVLPLVQGLRQQRLLFDFSTMGCPFDVALQYRQPNLPNRVRVLGDPHPARGPFVDWLRQARLDLPAKSLDAVYGDELRFTVPCLKIDLNPQGVTS
jgi:hypothetical protein